MSGRGVLVVGLLSVACGGGSGETFDAAPGDRSDGAPVAPGDAGGVDAGGADAGPPVSLTVTTSGEGAVVMTPPGVVCSGTCTEVYPHGTRVELTPSTVGCHRLGVWSGDCSGPEPCSLRLDADSSVSAEFVDGVSLTVAPPPIGAIVSDDGLINCPPDCYQAYDCDEEVTLQPSTQTYFSWAEPCAGDCACDLTLNESVAMEPSYTDPAAQPLVQIRGGRIFPSGLAVAPSGEMFVYGFYGGAILLDGEWFVPRSSLDLFIAKFSPAGEHVWSRRIEDDGGDSVVPLGGALDPAGDLVVTGEFVGETDLGDGPLASPPGNTTAFAAKYDRDTGALVWKVLLIADGGKSIGDVGTDGAGDVLIVGRLSGPGQLGDTAVTGGAGSAVLVAKLAGDDGDPIWVRTVRGADMTARGQQIAVDGDGAVIVGGLYRAPINFGCGALPAGAGPVAQIPDAFVAKLGPNGACRWSRAFSGLGYEDIADIAASGSEVVVGGSFTGEVTIEGETRASVDGSNWADGFVVAYSTNGDHGWTRFLPGPLFDSVQAVDVMPDGRTLVAGDHVDQLDVGGVDVCTVNQHTNAFAALYDDGGDLSWSREYGLESAVGCNCQPPSGYSYAVAVADDGTFWLAGQLVAAIDFGTGELESVHDYDGDAYVVSLDPR